MEEIKSPCIKVCRYDSSGMCYGCQRTLKEISNWSKYSDEERDEIMKACTSRTNADQGNNVFLR